MPSPPQTKTQSAFLRALCRYGGAWRLLSTSYQRGAWMPASPRRRRSSVRPPPKVLPRWATTATRTMPTLPVDPRSSQPKLRGRPPAEARGDRVARLRARPGPQRGAIDQLLGAAVEGPALQQLQVEVPGAGEDRLVP